MSLKTYRSRYTGREIDLLLSSIENKIDKSFITSEWVNDDTLAASTALTFNLNERLLKFGDPEYIRSLILSIPGSNIFTEEDKAKLERMANILQGTFENPTARNVAVNTIRFTGGELAFLMDDDTGTDTQEWSFWDSTNNVWKKARFLPDPASKDVSHTTDGVVVGITFDRSKFSAGKYVIKAESSSMIKLTELLVCVKGDNTFWTVQGDIGDGDTLFSVEECVTSPTDLIIRLRVTPNIVTKFYRVAEF